MRNVAVMVALSFGLAVAGTAQAQTPMQMHETLAKSSGCMNCHAMGAKKVGPSFKDTAAKFKGKADAEAAVLAKLADEKKHPPVKASAEDTKALVKWILSM